MSLKYEYHARALGGVARFGGVTCGALGFRKLLYCLSSPIRAMPFDRQVKRFRGGLVFKAHRLAYHSTLGWRVIKKKKRALLALPHSIPQKALRRVAQGSLLEIGVLSWSHFVGIYRQKLTNHRKLTFY